MITPGDRVRVEGIQGVHTVLSVADVLDPSVLSIQIRLAPGTIHGRYRGGDLLAVPASRCTRIGHAMPRSAAT